MTPLTESDLELDELLWRAFCREEYADYLDERDAMDEDEAVELAAGARMRPLSDE